MHAILWCALLAATIAAAADDLQLTILHTNDMHGRFDQTSANSGVCKLPASGRCYGGFARVAHVVRSYRVHSAADPSAPATLFLNAGDTYTGTSWFSVHKWQIAVDFINRLAPDCISFGNHEFDYGIEGLIPFVEHLKVPLVAANLDYSHDAQFTSSVPKSHVLTVRGMRIGVIGYLLPDTKILSSTGNVTFMDEVEAINAESQRLDGDGVRVIIALGHSGYETDKRIARDCPLVDIVVGGHTNTFLWNGMPPDAEEPEGPYPTLVTQPSGKVVPVVQAYAFTKYIGQLNVTISEAGDVKAAAGQPILLDSKVPMEEDIRQALDIYRPGLESATKRVVGITKVNLPIDNCRLEECNFGNLLADAYLEHQVLNYAGAYWTDTAVVILNGGGFRSAIDAGEITNGDLLGALPYDMPVITLGLTGADLRTALETAIRSNGETSRGEFLQVSGVRVTYDKSRPVGERVVKVDVRCTACKVPKYEPLDAQKVYRLVTNDFLASGGDGYAVLKEKALNRTVQDTSEMQIICNYIERRKVIYPEAGTRITFVPLDAAAESSALSYATRINHSFILAMVGVLTLMR